MKKSKKKLICITIVSLLLGGIMFFGFSYYNNQWYAKRLIDAIENNNVQQVEKLTETKFGNVDSLPIISTLLARISEQEYSTPLQEACRNGNYEIIRLLIKKNAKINYCAKKMNDVPPVVLAISSRSKTRLENVKLLIDNGADINFVNNYRSLLTSVASSSNEVKSIELFEYLESKTALKENDNHLKELLHYACRVDNSSLIHYFIIDRNMNINEQNEDGQTPLIYFAFPTNQKKSEDLKFLLDNGANKSIKDNEGKTAYDYAISWNPEFAELLKP